jgi:type II secretory pathway pseudopilin PulG
VERHGVDAGVIMHTQVQSETGISLIETMIAMLVLTVGAVGMAATFLQGMRATSSSPQTLVATQKAAEAIESVFSARDSHTIKWDELRNADQGIFLKNPQKMLVAGDDGILGTADDGKTAEGTGVLESVVLPGPDDELGTADDKKESLYGFTREIRITDVTDDLRLITVVITYPAGGAKQTYTLTAYISAVA